MLSSSLAEGKEGGPSERLIKQGGLEVDDLNEISQGVLVYRGNRLVCRLQGTIGSLGTQARTIADLMEDELSNREGEDARLGKRTFTQKNATS
mmetsp:Transcript_30969/g.38297  ORF Transcript_30969/g.38297 Transcript_30969/m.38297 type:complete len:93 (-) Transcript_30969:180-458(-)